VFRSLRPDLECVTVVAPTEPVRAIEFQSWKLAKTDGFVDAFARYDLSAWSVFSQSDLPVAFELQPRGRIVRAIRVELLAEDVQFDHVNGKRETRQHTSAHEKRNQKVASLLTEKP